VVIAVFGCGVVARRRVEDADHVCEDLDGQARELECVHLGLGVDDVVGRLGDSVSLRRKDAARRGYWSTYEESCTSIEHAAHKDSLKKEEHQVENPHLVAQSVFWIIMKVI
jgi:hypothetical protein